MIKKLLFSLVAIAFAGTANAQYFSMSVSSESALLGQKGSDISGVDGTGVSARALTTADATISGGSVTVTCGASDYVVRAQGSLPWFAITSKASQDHFDVTLNEAIKAGDIIKYQIRATNADEGKGVSLKFGTTTSNATVGPENSLDASGGTLSHSYTVKASDPFVGSKTLVIVRGAGVSIYFNNLTIEHDANAPVALVSYSNGNVADGTIELVMPDPGEGTPNIQYPSEQKYNKNSTKTVVYKINKSIVASEEFVAALKVSCTGGFKAGDKVTVQPFTSMSNSDFTGTSKYANIVIYSDATTQLYTTGGTAEARTVTDGHEEEGAPKEFTYTLESNYNELYIGRQGNTNIMVMKLEITRGGSTGIETVIAAAPAKAADNAWYTISGQRVSQPTKGLYIHNGKKVVIK